MEVVGSRAVDVFSEVRRVPFTYEAAGETRRRRGWSLRDGCSLPACGTMPVPVPVPAPASLESEAVKLPGNRPAPAPAPAPCPEPALRTSRASPCGGQAPFWQPRPWFESSRRAGVVWPRCPPALSCGGLLPAAPTAATAAASCCVLLRAAAYRLLHSDRLAQAVTLALWA